MNRDIALSLIALVAVAGVTYGLHSTVSLPPMSPSEPFVEGKKTGPGAAAAPKDDSPVIMHVNGEPVTEAEFNEFLESVPEQQRAMAATPEGRRLFSDALVQQIVLEQKGREMGLDRDPEIRDQLGVAEGRMIAMKALEKLVTPNEAEVRAEYDKMIDLSHILIAHQGGQVPPKSGQPLPVEQAMQKANAISGRLRGGADFAQIARAESDDQRSAQEGGRLGPVTAADLGPELGAAIAQLKQGEISNPVRSGYGIHIFKVGRRTAQDYAQVRPMIEQRMQQERLQAALARELESAKVERDPKFFGTQAAPRQLQPMGGKSPS